MIKIHGRKIAAAVFLLSLLTALTVWLFSPSLPYIRGDVIREDVYFLGQSMRGLSAEQAEELLVARFVEWQHNPVDAVYDQERQVVVPELWGYRVDIEKTLERILTASSGQAIFPTLEAIHPDISVADYPAAFIEQGNLGKNEVALMINVAWGSEYLPSMLEVLASENARGTFFVVGKWGEKNEPLLREMARQGHELANHGHTDAVVYTQLTPDEMEKGLKEVNNFIEAATGQTVKYFTPHKGEYNQLVLEVVSRVGMRTVLWTLDTVDWSNPGVEKMKQRVLTKLEAGSIILMHPTEDTVTFLQEALPVIKGKGLTVVTMDELFSPHYPPAAISLCQ